MRKRTNEDQPLFDFLFIDAADVAEHPHAIGAMYDKKLDGVIVRNVFGSETMKEVCERLAADRSMARHAFPVFAHLADAPHLIGKALVESSGDLRPYFEEAELFRRHCRALFGSDVDFEARVGAIFRALSGGLPVEVAPGPYPGSTYTPATVRVLPEGHEIGVHVGNEFLRQPQSAHLRSFVDMTDQLSYFVPLAVPEGGGELVVYGLEWDDVSAFLPEPTEPDEGNIHFEGSPVYEEVCRMDSTAYAPRPGDMLLFDGGRYYHRVSKVIGRSPRRTIGGFLGFSRQRDRVYYWS